MTEFDKKYDIVDESTPPNTFMCGRYKRSFAYYTLSERLPVILTQVVDKLITDYDYGEGENSRDELKTVVGNISKLKYELQTDKVMTPLTVNEPDTKIWNNFLNSLTSENNSYFKTCWLYAECYTYRKLKSIFESTNTLKNFDYFRRQKENALTCCENTLEAVGNSIRHAFEISDIPKNKLLITLLKLNLWGNRCDLSITAGKEIKQTGNPFEIVNSLDEYIISDNSEIIASFLLEQSTIENRIIDFVNDNAGYELFTDFIVADFLITNKLAKKIRFHVKSIPWFISDVTHNDFKWTLKYLSEHSSNALREIGKKWTVYLQDGNFELCESEYFWTSPYEFYRMPEVCPSLYNKLSEAHLVIFKGDLNYRKLIGDYTWNFTEKFQTCLRGFLPTNICSLRTVKADLICGLKLGVSEELFKKDSNWMETGQYGVIQFANKD